MIPEPKQGVSEPEPFGSFFHHLDSILDPLLPALAKPAPSGLDDQSQRESAERIDRRNPPSQSDSDEIGSNSPRPSGPFHRRHRDRSLQRETPHKVSQGEPHRAGSSPQAANPAGTPGATMQEMQDANPPKHNPASEQHPEAQKTQEKAYSRPYTEGTTRTGTTSASGSGTGSNEHPDSESQMNARKQAYHLQRVSSNLQPDSSPLPQASSFSRSFPLSREAGSPDWNNAPVPTLNPASHPNPVTSSPAHTGLRHTTKLEKIYSLVRDHAITLKRFGKDFLKAEIRPDSQTRILLSLHSTGDAITVSAQVDAQNTEWLRQNWMTLQSKLAEQKIFLEEPGSKGEESHDFESSTGHSGRHPSEPDSEADSDPERRPNSGSQNPPSDPAQNHTNPKVTAETVYWA